MGLPLFLSSDTVKTFPYAYTFYYHIYLSVCLLFCCWNKICSGSGDPASVGNSGALPQSRVAKPSPGGWHMEGANRSSFHLHRLWNCLEVQEHQSHQGRAATLELQEEASQSQRRQRSPTMNLIFAFMGPFPGPQAPDPTGPAVLPWIQVALPWPSRSLKHGKSACYIGSSLRSGLIHIEGREALSNTNPRIYSAQKGAK